LRTARFWLLAISFLIVAGVCNGTIAHVVPFLTDRGVSPGGATRVLATGGIALIVGRLLAGYLLDRIFAPYVAVAFFLSPLIGIVLLLSASQPAMAAAGTVLVGLGLGAEVDLIAFLLSRYLGMRSFGEIYGYLFAIFMLGSGLGPFVMGVSFDRRGSYNLMLECFGFVLVAASILILRLGPYVYPASKRHNPNAAPPIVVKIGSPTATDQNGETAFD
jgi:predicted MFS family arabinose efflux permease